MTARAGSRRACCAVVRWLSLVAAVGAFGAACSSTDGGVVFDISPRSEGVAVGEGVQFSVNGEEPALWGLSQTPASVRPARCSP